MYSEALLTGQNLSLSEALAMGGQTTVIGLAIVFAVLIILMIVLSLFKVIFYKKPKTQAAPAAAPAQAAPVEEEYRRTDNKMPAWNKAGVTETINNRF